MKNKYIELVKKWLADKDSVSLEELKANSRAAGDAYAAAANAAVNTTYSATYAAYVTATASNAAAAYATAEAAYWVKQYEEML